MTEYYGLGMGPNKATQPLLARHNQLVSRVGCYEADTTVTYATDVIQMLKVPAASVLLDVWLWSPTGFGATCVVDMGTISGGTLTDFSDASAVNNTITDNGLFRVTLAEADVLSATAETVIGFDIDSIVTQPAAGDYIVMGVTYQTFQIDWPD